MALKTDYKDYIPPSGGRKYKITANSDGSSSVEDITQYQQVGDTWGAEDINQVNKLVNGAVYPNLLDNSDYKIAQAGYNGAHGNCALPGFVDSKNEEKTERNAGYLVVSQSGGGMLRQGTREGIRRTPANRGMRAHRIVKGLDISEDVCHGMCP